MIIETKFSGSVEITDEDIITFDDGLLGFEDIKRYILIDIEENVIFKSLQSVDNSKVAFIVINPWDIFSDYEINIDDDELIPLNDTDMKNIMVYSLLTVLPNSITANLVGPVIVNTKTHKGKQVVLYKSNYMTRHDVLQKLMRD